ncbi:hypothetical protein CLF_101719 [Clonorchis sinensis]|uniref:Uncharacterized protein n=1 Tax=Clonorchis sinensis TaxID=79923 RepID=G7Y6E5_CLOSI|nr:hypothetical protein CLF_101719 [Clonorchis sinensis]
MATKQLNALNPRNFKEKIELLKKKEAASTANFAAAIRDAREICQIAGACDPILKPSLGSSLIDRTSLPKAYSLPSVSSPASLRTDAKADSIGGFNEQVFTVEALLVSDGITEFIMRYLENGYLIVRRVLQSRKNFSTIICVDWAPRYTCQNVSSDGAARRRLDPVALHVWLETFQEVTANRLHHVDTDVAVFGGNDDDDTRPNRCTQELDFHHTGLITMTFGIKRRGVSRVTVDHAAVDPFGELGLETFHHHTGKYRHCALIVSNIPGSAGNRCTHPLIVVDDSCFTWVNEALVVVAPRLAAFLVGNRSLQWHMNPMTTLRQDELYTTARRGFPIATDFMCSYGVVVMSITCTSFFNGDVSPPYRDTSFESFIM